MNVPSSYIYKYKLWYIHAMDYWLVITEWSIVTSKNRCQSQNGFTHWRSQETRVDNLTYNPIYTDSRNCKLIYRDRKRIHNWRGREAQGRRNMGENEQERQGAFWWWMHSPSRWVTVSWCAHMSEFTSSYIWNTCGSLYSVIPCGLHHWAPEIQLDMLLCGGNSPWSGVFWLAGPRPRPRRFHLSPLWGCCWSRRGAAPCGFLTTERATFQSTDS